MHARSSFNAALLATLLLATPAWAQTDTPPVRATVNGETVTAEALDARQYDLIDKQTIVTAVLDEDKQLSRNPAVQQELKRLMAVVVQEKPEGTREEIRAAVQEKAVVYTQTMAVRRVKPKLFADVEAKALDQLIDEQLMLQEAKRQGIEVSDAEVDQRIATVGPRAGTEDEPLHKLLVAWDKRALPSVRARARADLAWTAALKKRLGAAAETDFAAVSQKELATLKAAATISKP